MPMLPSEREAFIESGDSRETSVSVMTAIADVSSCLEIAEQIWEEGIEHWTDHEARAFLDVATRDGTLAISDLCWGCSSGLDIVPDSLRAEYED
jgi:hypothetical protein